MSAEAEIIALLSHATSNASSLAAASSNMTNTAASVLDELVELRGSPKKIYEAEIANDDDLFSESREPPIGFPAWPTIELAEFPELQAISEINANPFWSSSFPSLLLPEFIYPRLVSPSKFTKTPPTVSTAIAMPAIPDTDNPFNPSRLELDEITDPVLTVDAPEFMSVDVDISLDTGVFKNALDSLTNSIFNGDSGLTGLNEILADLGGWSQRLLDALLPEILAIFERRFSDKYAPVLSFHNQITARLSDRLATEHSRVLSASTIDRSGWDLPQAVQQAIANTVQQVSAAWQQQAQGQSDIKTAELALQFFEFCGSLFANFNNGIQALKVKELEYTLEAHRLSIAYAKQVVAALLAQYEAENFTKQDAEFQEAEAQLKLFEAELQVAMIRYDIAKANLQVEEARQDNDAALIKNYRTDVEKSGLDVQIYASQVNASRSELEVKQLPFEVFDLEVKLFDAQINAHKATVDLRVAELSGDSAKIEGELMKVKAFEAEVRSFEKQIATKLAIVDAQSDRNAAVIKEFEALIKAELLPIEQSQLTNDYELKKYKITADNVLSNAELALDDLKALMNFTDRKQDGLLKAYELTQERNLELMSVELERLKAIAETNTKGAAIMANMAQGAMSAANGVASVIFEESA